VERRLAAILAADVVGYSRLMGADEAGTMARLEDLKSEVLVPLIAQHRGRVVKLMGDGFLVEFASVVDALTCALAWQEAVEAQADQTSEDWALRFRIGVNLGDIMVEDDDIYGDGVNVAARLEGLAEADGRVIAMLHSFVMPPRNETGDEIGDEAAANDNGEPVDPVLQPYAELEDPGSIYVSGVAVTPEHRGRGLGRELMEQARARAEALDLSWVSLICFEANETAMQLYRRLGYAEVDRRPVVPHPSLHCSEGDAVLLVRGLD
jgi:ribosomal protein S18 acetylase RimI-like enzyme